MIKAVNTIAIIIVIFGTVLNLNNTNFCQSIKKTPVMNPDIEVTQKQEGLASFYACKANINYPKNWEIVKTDKPYLKASIYPIRGNSEDVFVAIVNPLANFSREATLYEIQKYYYESARCNKAVIDENRIEATPDNTEVLTFSSHVVKEDNTHKDYQTTVIFKNNYGIVGLYYYALTNELREKYAGAFKSITNSLTFN